ncbi:glycosyltransferase family 1 protein [Cryobacterium sp. TMT4-31]|uniref:glycosyltransferase family 4 protein n=1 Tax=Cryobacterium sp. TMT4-31 TaxID=1259259 RepID=UPI00106DC617|nr:glycosyltransferase family 1 protein [Cryobacterium sp. TMT4-31]TFC89884.1 glycosyltransferase family 1 protein [Cryobacterium sp. TMT4-31]
MLREFIFTWVERYPEDEVVVAVPRAAGELARSELGGQASVRTTRIFPHGLSNILELPFVARRMRADIAVTHNFSPMMGKSAVFVHDFMFKSNPEWFTVKERAYFALMPLSLPRASLVFTSTKTEARRVKMYGRRSSLPTDIGLGLGRELQASVASRPSSLPQSDEFVLAVGRLNIRKNLSMTIESALASGSITRLRPLVIVGEASGRGINLSTAARDAQKDGTVVFLGQISDSELKWLYERARVFLFLTLDEGFGMPVLESLSFATPMIVSDIPVFREILGRSATYVDPLDGLAISQALKRELAQPRVGASASHVLDYFTWDAAVDRMRNTILKDLNESNITVRV